MMKKQWIFILLAVLCLFLGMGVCQAEGAQVSGIVWLDKTVDGLRVDELGLSDAAVTLIQRNLDGTETELATAKSAKNGSYAFAVSQPGEYCLEIKLPKDYQFTIHGQDSCALPAQENVSRTPYFTLANGEMAEMNIGATKSTCYISIYAFEDENQNGGRMQSEPKLRNVLVELFYEYEEKSYLVASATTNRDGEISIRDLSAGTYYIKTTLPENYVIGPLGEKINGFYNCILAQDDNLGVSAPFTLEPKSSIALGIGTVRTGSLKGQVWLDENANGKWDSNAWESQESGMEGALITLYSPSLNLTRETIVSASGDYAFKGLQPGNYELTVTLPDGMLFTYPGSSLISDPTPVGKLNVSVQVETTTTLNPIGAVHGTPYTVHVYEGDHPEAAPGFAGASLSVYQSGKQVKSLISDENGSVLFHLRPGEATLKCTLPEGFVFMPHSANVFTHSISFATDAHECLITVDETAVGGNGIMIYVTRPAAISGFLFEDPVNAGVYTENCSPLPGFTVQAVDASGAVMAETVTDHDGNYSLFPLLPGNYTVHFLLNDPYVASPYADVSNGCRIVNQTPDYGETIEMQLLPGQHEADVDGAVFRAGVVEGYVQLNANHDNLATSEGGMAGVTVTLLDEYGAPVADYAYDITDENGYYQVKGVLPGNYSLLYTLPEDAAFTLPLTDDAETESESFTIGSGSKILMNPLGAVHTATMAGWVMDDLSIPVDAQLTLTSHTFGTLYETAAMEDGFYMFYGLRPDTYTLSVTLPDGYVFGAKENSPLYAIANHHGETTVTFAMGDVHDNADFLAALPSSLSASIFYDANLSAAQEDGEKGIEMRSYSLWLGDLPVAEGDADVNGEFSLDGLVPGMYTLRIPLDEQEVPVNDPAAPGTEAIVTINLAGDAAAHLSVPILRYASISGEVWSLDGTSNGVGGIPVSLMDATGASVSSAVTDSEGWFEFTTLLPGEYTLSAQLPDGYLFAREQDTQEQSSYIISQPDGTAAPLPIDLPMGDDVSGIDIGMGAMGRIGDRAWLDENGNGMQDIGEANMPGILVELYQHGQFIASATTDVYGLYSISNLYPGEYEMRVAMHDELKATACQTEFPLVASILPESDDNIITVSGIIVPSGGQNLHYDLGFQLRKKGVYPEAMESIPTKDWRPYTER